MYEGRVEILKPIKKMHEEGWNSDLEQDGGAADEDEVARIKAERAKTGKKRPRPEDSERESGDEGSDDESDSSGGERDRKRRKKDKEREKGKDRKRKEKEKEKEKKQKKKMAKLKKELKKTKKLERERKRKEKEKEKKKKRKEKEKKVGLWCGRFLCRITSAKIDLSPLCCVIEIKDCQERWFRRRDGWQRQRRARLGQRCRQEEKEQETIGLVLRQ